VPTAPSVACRCGKLDCTEHGRAANRKQFDRQRSSDPVRSIYNTARWQRTRAFIIQRDPLCMIAKLCVERFGVRLPSKDADHIVPIRQGGDPWDPENLQGACHECHAHKTALESKT
jgi:5-methylcytosine-specific restriction enzyme A